MSERHLDLVRALREAVLESPAATAASLRRAVEARAARLGGRVAEGTEGDAVPAELAGFVDRVTRSAFAITDAEVLELRRAGYSEDAIFEIAASAALGAALARLERGLSVLQRAG